LQPQVGEILDFLRNEQLPHLTPRDQTQFITKTTPAILRAKIKSLTESARGWNQSDLLLKSSPSKLFLGHTARIKFLGFSADQRSLISAADDRFIRKWNFSNQNEIDSVYMGRIDSPVFAQSADSKVLYNGERDGYLQAFNLGVLKPKYRLNFTLRKIHSLAISPDGTHLFSGLQGGEIEMWKQGTTDPRNWTVTSPYIVNGFGSIEALAISPDGKILMAATKNSMISLWSNETREGLKKLGHYQRNFNAMKISPDSKILFVGTDYEHITLWNLDDLSKPPIDLKGHRGPIFSFAFSNNNQILFSGAKDGSIGVWDATTLSLKYILKTSDLMSSVTALLPNANGKFLYSGHSDGTIRAWNLRRADLLDPTRIEATP
jgi:WD40 repeat protein